MPPMRTYDLIVVGGGPAGSTTAAMASRAGLRVLLLEADSHPRAHVGESLLPGIIPILDKMGALAEVEAAGFTRKTGSTHWGWGRTPEWDLWFKDSEEYPYAWLVDRSRFDAILLRVAKQAGAEVRENAAVTDLSWERDRLVGVVYRARGDEGTTEVRAPFTVDASGQAMLLARRLRLRESIEGLQHEASWAHFEGSGRLPAPRGQQALFVATETSWLWHFPLSETRTSVGIVRTGVEDRGKEEGREAAYDEAVAASSRLQSVLGPGARRVTPVRNLHDWSYQMTRLAGPGWMLAGDSSGFIDPVLSTGVQLAMNAGFHAAGLIASVLRGERTEERAHADYTAQHRAIFADMLRIVRYFYKQNLHRDDYFWESKRILVGADDEVSPRKAFMVLTSGLARNIAFDAKRAETVARREADAAGGAGLDDAEPARLRYVCIHMRWAATEPAADLYFLIEPADPSAPSLVATRSWHLNCLAPRLGKDILRVPGLAKPLDALCSRIRDLDDRRGESLAAFWARCRASIAETVRSLPPPVALVRVFGE